MLKAFIIIIDEIYCLFFIQSEEESIYDPSQFRFVLMELCGNK